MEEKSEEGRMVVVSQSRGLFGGDWRMMEEHLCSFVKRL